MLARILSIRARCTLLWRRWRPWLSRWGLAIAVIAVLIAIVQPMSLRPATDGEVVPITVQHIIAQAQAAYIAPPTGEGVIHRRWEIALERPRALAQADEWVDGQSPARHRMQLVHGTVLQEWQMGDGSNGWQYEHSAPFIACGPPPTNAYQGVHAWQLPPAEQAELRTARWRSGVWALGLRYLERAQAADSLRSLGVSGRGSDAVLVLAAEGRTISGTLLLRLDPLNYGLREVREIQTRAGTTTTRVPWRLVETEMISSSTAKRQGLLDRYPGTKPPVMQHTEPLIDQACPLTALGQAVSLPRLLRQIGERLIGLPDVLPSMEHVLLLGQRYPGQPQDSDAYNVEQLTLVYLSPGKRLMITPRAWSMDRDDMQQQAGSWLVQIDDRQPSMITANLVDAHSPSELNWASGQLQVWADGWTRDELLPVLAQLRPLTLRDWAHNPDIWPEPTPFDPVTRAHVIRLLQASDPQPGATLYQRTTYTLRHPPFLATLQDPYHLLPALNPAERHTERWVTYDGNGDVERSRSTTTAASGELLRTSLREKETVYYYNAVRNTVYTNTLTTPEPVQPSELFGELLLNEWTWHTSSDGSLIAQRTAPITDTEWRGLLEGQRADEGAYFAPWLLDPELTHIRYVYVWAPDGTLRNRDTWGSPGAQATDPPILLERTMVETHEWQPSAPSSVWSFTPPPDTIQLQSGPLYRPYQPRTLYNPKDVEVSAAFPLWFWNENTPFHFTTGLMAPDPPMLPYAFWPWTFDSAVMAGQAVQLDYTTPKGKLQVIQGPSAPLRQLLQQIAPLWSSSAEETWLTPLGPSALWTMHNRRNNQHWAVLELDGTLLYLHLTGPADEWQMVLNRLPSLQLVDD